ncbi:hypothetical protein GCM10011365_15740 [Marinicella pacifica]|jgi:uncharacterized protein YciI|uniref:YCII-related domain-containing protein n=1 Tax=Marinicella pacifica TaxID=1171543 RepID=A0A917CPX7_9GAMM|nr:YciI family protein [Marinicella pacifica]GGF95267.1 hypothetical protein GCM10011365_15740 [Marinicella pacifica]
MKIIDVMVLLLMTNLSVAQQDYDAELAQSLGADDYGMKIYVLALLKPGPNQDQDQETAQQLQQAHLANIRRLAEAGQLVLAGPFMPNEQDLRGIYVFDVATVEAAKQLTETDPAIKAGRLRMELIPWYGSATLPMINQWHKKISKKSF